MSSIKEILGELDARSGHLYNQRSPPSRSLSAARSVVEDQAQPDDITFNDPSDRMKTKIDEMEEDVSEEERLDVDDGEFHMADGGRSLPNFMELKSHEKKPIDEMTIFNEKILMKKAEKAKLADQVYATGRAIANAQSVGNSVPQSTIQTVQDEAKRLGSTNVLLQSSTDKEHKEHTSRVMDYSVYKKKVILPGDDFISPYTSKMEDKIDTELAKFLNEKTKIGEIESDVINQRAVRTITRGNFFEQLILNDEKHPKTFMLCLDFSQESNYALEWAIGTVLVDGSVLYLFNILEDDSYSDLELNGTSGSTPSLHPSTSNSSTSETRERQRVGNVQQMTTLVQSLITKTKLQVHIVSVSCHHPIPKQFMISIIKHMSPTLVIVGSKGQSSLRGVINNSLSSHLVRHSSTPVMVVRSRLKKLAKKSKFTNVVSGLAGAKAD